MIFSEAEVKDAESYAEELAGLVALILLIPRRAVEFQPSLGEFTIRGKRITPQGWARVLGTIETATRQRLRSAAMNAYDQPTKTAWSAETQKLITSSHLITAALALGGLTVAAASTLVFQLVQAQRTFLERFRRQFEAGATGSAGQTSARAGSYAVAATIAFYTLQQQAKRVAGYTEARRIRRALESCEGCITWARRGWVPISEQPRIGGLDCGSRCRCYLEYR